MANKKYVINFLRFEFYIISVFKKKTKLNR